jgi:hypothetical protein
LAISKPGNVHMFNVILRRVRVTYCCSEKAVSTTYSECMSVALVIQHAKRMRRVTLSALACLALPCFSTLSHNSTTSGKNIYMER